MIYDLVLFLYLLFLVPVVFFGRLRGKRHPALLQRLGFFLPENLQKGGIWIHAVSVGEVKAAVPFFRQLKQAYPEKFICITTTTATGFAEAKRSLKEADTFLYSPIDFSFVVRRFVKRLQPSLFILVEGDFWPNLLKELKCKIFLVSGRVSQKTASRWQMFPSFANKLFSKFDLLCVQSDEYAKRFLPFAGDKVRVTGNLKFDIEPEKIKDVSLPKDFITICSTHAPEEEKILDHLEGRWKVFLAPRHPERFDEVARLLKKKGISFARFSESGWNLTSEKVLLMDVMGQLGTCYTHSKLAIVGGSFVPGIGGHNVLEPCLYGCPSLFGPYTFSQEELVQKVLESKVGKRSSFESILEDVTEGRYLEPSVETFRGASAKTWKEISLAIKYGLE